MINIDIREESVELSDGGWRLASLGKELIKKLQGLSSLKVSIPVSVIFVEYLQYHDLDIFILIKWNVKEILDEKECFEFSKDSIVVKINLLINSVELRKRSRSLALSLKDFVDHTEGLSSFQESVSIEVMPFK